MQDIPEMCVSRVCITRNRKTRTHHSARSLTRYENRAMVDFSPVDCFLLSRFFLLLRVNTDIYIFFFFFLFFCLLVSLQLPTYARYDASFGEEKRCSLIRRQSRRCRSTRRRRRSVRSEREKRISREMLTFLSFEEVVSHGNFLTNDFSNLERKRKISRSLRKVRSEIANTPPPPREHFAV